MPIENLGHEHEFEPQYGLPERLPPNEYLVWQGSPDVGMLATSAFHIRKLAIYFVGLTVLCVWLAVQKGADVMGLVDAVKWVLPLGIITLLTVWWLAYMTARTTVYTITNRRVVLRVGIVLTVTFNLPLPQIASADIRKLDDGFGDITLALKGADRIAWIHLWPSVRAWRIRKPEPTLRAIPDAQAVAAKLRDAWTHNTGMAANATTEQANSTRGVPGFQVSPT
jgi:hypothetical protein